MLKIIQINNSTREELRGKFFIQWDESFSQWDRDIAGLLNISLRKYRNILRRYKAFKYENGDYYFDRYDDIKGALETLEPYYILSQLLK